MHQQSSSPLPEGRRGGEKKTKQEKNKTTKALRRENKKQIKKQKGGKKKSIFYIKKTLLLLSPWSSSIFLCLYIYTHICIYIYMYINLYIFSPCPWRGERGFVAPRCPEFRRLHWAAGRTPQPDSGQVVISVRADQSQSFWPAVCFFFVFLYPTHWRYSA